MADPGTFVATGRTVPLRHAERASHDVAAAAQVLDEALVCHVGFVVDGAPRVLPTLHARVGDTLYLHGSTGGRLGLAGRDGPVPVCVTATLLDGLVLARSQFHHSVNYRSVVAHGPARLVDRDEEKTRALTALIDKVAAGRSADSRAPSARELAQTAVLALRLVEASVKCRTGGPVDDPADLDLPYWAGVVPVRLARGAAQPADRVSVPLPEYLR